MAVPATSASTPTHRHCVPDRQPLIHRHGCATSHVRFPRDEKVLLQPHGSSSPKPIPLPFPAVFDLTTVADRRQRHDVVDRRQRRHNDIQTFIRSFVRFVRSFVKRFSFLSSFEYIQKYQLYWYLVLK